MLSEQEKKEMLEDARSKGRRDDFRAAQGHISNISFDQYIKALDDLQKIFFTPSASRHISITRFNKL